ncbi:putative DNA primase/helicase [Novosphingobium kunmingense]|uniref:Putative DNA primase/helicase n=1 Tax=Novosphingobium kunmingense TaxID=1211806 RepID=A0A2N0HL09_9SPHN|nr:putative DNA primase/helicase [Novosphingobium kunmingense]
MPDFAKDLACARLPLTDLGNAERWRVRHGDDFRFCPEIGWFAWDKRRWRLLSEEKDRLPAPVMQSVFLTVRAIRNEAALVAASGFAPPSEPLNDRDLWEFERWAEAFGLAERDTYLRSDSDGSLARALDALEPLDVVLGAKKQAMWSHKIAAWAKTSEGAGKLQSVAALAKAFPDIAIEPDQLDQDRMAINVLNGTLRLERAREKRPSSEVEAGKSEWRTAGWRVKLHRHDRADLMTKLAPVKYAPGATCPEYDAFIERVQPDETMRRFVHQWGGLSLTGDISEQKLAFFYGSGRNGKGTWVETVAAIVGDYAGSIPIDSFMTDAGKRRGDQATPDIARLPGVRFLRASEPDKGAALNEGLIKQVTGGDPVDARHLNKGFFTFLPSFKMTISGNHKPKIKGTDDGIWRRMQLVPWGVQIPPDQVDRKLGDRMRDSEASGILNRLLAGLIDWRTHGLVEPDQVREATRAYRDDSDELGRFLSDMCEVSDDPKVRIKSTELFQFYEAWCQASGREAWKQRGFVGAMRDKQFEQLTSNGMWWVKVRIRPGILLDDVKAGAWRADDEKGDSGAPDDVGDDPWLDGRRYD